MTTFLQGVPEALRVADMPNLDARCMALLAGPGGGKTEALSEFCLQPGLAVVAFDPVGQLAKRMGEKDSDAVVVRFTADWRARLPSFLPTLARWIKERRRVCIVIPPSIYEDAKDAVEAVMRHLIKRAENGDSHGVLFVFEECQRFIPQSDAFSRAVVAAAEMGRNWMWGRVFATQRPASMQKEVLARCDAMFLGRVSHPRDVDQYREALELNIPDRQEREAILRRMLHLQAGEFILRESSTPPKANGGL